MTDIETIREMLNKCVVFAASDHCAEGDLEEALKEFSLTEACEASEAIERIAERITGKRDVMLAGAIHGLKGYCSATPTPTHPNTDPYELLGAWNRWNERLQDHYIPELLKAFENGLSS